MLDCETQGEQRAHFGRALLQAELKQERHEQQRCDHKENAEAKE
ncbi:MAG TPA: hypothetical protein VE988_01005 [Gemmataceae bacterium]|nr:hypothetical protein [Gemmataceae bacterium]